MTDAGSPPAAPQHVRVERATLKGRELGEIVLDRPDKRNALTPAMLCAACEAARELIGDPAVQAIVLRSEGETFCAGFDLDACHDDESALPSLLSSLAELIGLLRGAPKPVVIGVQGAAVAGAAALLTAADLVVADMQAKIGYPVVRLGISPAVSAPTLASVIGTGAARARLLNPELIDAERAHELGWVHVLVSIREDVRPRAQIEAAKLADKPPHALAQTKAWLNEVDRPGSADAQRAGLAASLALAGSHEQRDLLARVLRR
jgi:methylglutaconyl-CoA hydratase